MADNITATKPADSTVEVAVLATDECSVNSVTVHVPWTKLGYGTFDAFTPVTSAAPLPVTISGVATAANQATGNTSLATLAGAVSGAEMQVDIVASLPAGTNAIGKLAANDGVDIGDVTINNASIAVTGTFWQATQPVSIAAAVGVTDNSGSLTVDDGGATISIDDGGGSITVDGSVSVSGEVDVLPASPIASEFLPVRLTDGTSFVSALPITDNSGSITVDDGNGSLSIDDNGGSLTVDGTVAATQSGTWNVGTVTAVTGITNALPAGTNNIGDVDVLTQPARARATDTISAAIATDALMSGTTALTPKFAKISAAASGDNTLVAAVTSKKIRVLSLFLVNSGTAVSVYFTSGAGGTAISGDSTNKIPLDKTGAAGPAGFSLGHNPQGWFETASGAALMLNLSAAQGVAGHLTYLEV